LYQREEEEEEEEEENNNNKMMMMMMMMTTTTMMKHKCTVLIIRDERQFKEFDEPDRTFMKAKIIQCTSNSKTS
jgi:UDP-glucose 6-dehydrogenase